MMLGDTNSFRGHCASALTHPVTIASLVVLLLNDALFKSLWPGSWVTGKLSDLAWVVFASPLLAFVLSLFLSRRLFGRRRRSSLHTLVCRRYTRHSTPSRPYTMGYFGAFRG